MIISLALLSLLTSLAYGARWTHLTPSLMRSALKVGATASLTLIALHLGTPPLLIAALALGALGDLALSRDGTTAFLVGLSAFLAGHLCYCFLLAKTGVAPPNSPGQFAALAALITLASALYIRLATAFGALRGPVLLYIIVSLALGALTLCLTPPAPPALVAGVGLFIASDMMLAFDLFAPPKGVRPRALLRSGLWFAYWSGQSLILWGMLAL